MKAFYLTSVILCFSIVVLVIPNIAKANDLTPDQQAREFVIEVSNRVLGVIQANEIDDSAKEEELMEIFERNVDTDWMARFVLGRYFHSADDKLQNRYLDLYHKYLLYSYVPKFKEYTGQNFEIIRITANSGNNFIVHTKFMIANTPEVRVDYRVVKNERGKFKIIDIIGEGISLITTQRSDFGGLVSRKGVAYFVDKLEAKVKKLLAQRSS